MSTLLLNEVEKHYGFTCPRILSTCQGYSVSHFILSNPENKSIFLKRFTTSSFSILSSQTSLITHLVTFVTQCTGARSNLYFHTPSILPTVKGDLFVSTSNDEILVAFQVVKGHVLNDWLQLDEARLYSDVIVKSVGSLIGRLDVALQSWKAPNSTRVLTGFEKEAVDSNELSHDLNDRISIWDLRHSMQHLESMHLIPECETKKLIEKGFKIFQVCLLPLYISAEEKITNNGEYLRRSWIHGDAHDCNIIIRENVKNKDFNFKALSTLTSDDLSLIDFDDTCYSYLIHNAVISLTYLILWSLSACKNDSEKLNTVKDVGSAFFKGYCETMPLLEIEIKAVFPLLITRLSTSLFMSIKSAAVETDKERINYIQMHAKDAQLMLHWLLECGKDVETELVNAWMDTAFSTSNAQKDFIHSYCPYTSLLTEQEILSQEIIKELILLGDNNAFSNVIEIPSGQVKPLTSVTPLGCVVQENVWGTVSVNSLESRWLLSPPFVNNWSESSGSILSSIVGSDPEKLKIFTEISNAPLVSIDKQGSISLARLGWGKYMENRVIYQSDLFLLESEPRSLHLGVDLGTIANTPVHAPLDGEIHSWARNNSDLDYGPTILLKHTLPSGREIFTLFGHLSLDSLFDNDGVAKLRVGMSVKKGDVIAYVGSSDVNGGWPPHLHFQLMTEKKCGGWRGDYPGVCSPSHMKAYMLLTPDPNLILRCPFIEKIGW
jgi:peptidoglycan LD-endopeptidase LytH